MTSHPDILQFMLPMQQGKLVRQVQAALAVRGFLSPDGVDGLFGPRTRDAVTAFQRGCQLAGTGIVDAPTRARLLGHGTGQAVRPDPAEDLAALRQREVPPVVPAAQLPPARARRVILHWTAGTHIASAHDRECYHFLVEFDEGKARVVRGRFSIADNDSTRDGRYAAHTRKLNTGSVGVAVCGMAKAEERPFDPGHYPIMPEQIQLMARLVAQICARYDIPVNRKSVLGHGEVQEFLGVAQHGKWDVLVLPWAPDLSKRAVGDHLRVLVAEALTGLNEAVDQEARDLDVLVDGARVAKGAFASDGMIWGRLERLMPVLGLTLADVAAGHVTLQAGDVIGTMALYSAAETMAAAATGAVRLDDLAAGFDLGLTIDEAGAVVLTGAPGGGDQITIDTETFRKVTIARGDMLSTIAQREMGAGADWRQIRTIEGRPFDDATARRVQPGQQVLIPISTLAPQVIAPPAKDQLARIAEAIAKAAVPGNAKAALSATRLILPACTEQGITDPAHLAYVLATAEHETNFGREMEEKWDNTPRQRAYQGRYGNTDPGDGKRFRGRGYVQLTFRDNYRRFGDELGLNLVQDPDLAAQPDHAARILALGMGRLGYRSRKMVLRAYGAGADFQFERARDIVNGDRHDNAQKRYGTTIGSGIARQARKFFFVLREALS